MKTDSNFKVGDTVKIKAGLGDYGKYVGNKYKVIGLHDEGVYVDNGDLAWNLFWFNEVSKIEDTYETLDSGARKEFVSGMVRDTDESKPQYDLIDFDMLKRWAELMERGAKKYGKHNWKKADSVEEMDRFKSSALRHLIQWFNGETDEDHASAVYFNIAGAEMVKKKINDRGGKEGNNIDESF